MKYSRTTLTVGCVQGFSAMNICFLSSLIIRAIICSSVRQAALRFQHEFNKTSECFFHSAGHNCYLKDKSTSHRICNRFWVEKKDQELILKKKNHSEVINCNSLIIIQPSNQKRRKGKFSLFFASGTRRRISPVAFSSVDTNTPTSAQGGG